MKNLQQINSDFVQFNVQLKKLGADLCTIRKEINYSQSDVVEWIMCDRRKVAEIEAGECQDFALIFKYCQKLSIELNINYTVH